ncbi:signal transduction histidine kinase [Wenyingzhuangia heitensis]|uniref:histidine kinase n=1 Tax=Wenyingzhuangia heitensis TaxID=1487859 RepID=A0ABX0UBT8_9FLAO|nr:sensor histidine kinase [Wenyingzhuangia heitensis]NIJ46294.1 signal transduction histidine kinase [Wenyingzhuangia heitensis]
MSIKTWIIIIINSLLFVVVIALSTSFYNQFEKTLNEKILSQLSSIERLKRVQIEKYLDTEWNRFQYNSKDSIRDFNLSRLQNLPFKIKTTGIYDFTPISKNGNLLIGLIKVENNKIVSLKTLSNKYVQQILLERTGMGQSGETYLVGQDYKLRSASRFLTNQAPYSITAKTKSVQNAFQSVFKTGIYKDYRNVWVYSTYNTIKISNLHWAILSEMDVEEVMQPLQTMQLKLLIIACSILVIALLLGNYFTQFLSRPLKTMETQLLAMANGNYNINMGKKTHFKEINDILKALNSLKESLTKAISFSHEVGEMKLDSNYQPKSKADVLGNSLVKMKDKLIEYQTKVAQANTNKKRILIEGQETERKRLAQELHDGIGPLLTSLRFFVENMNIDLDEKDKMKALIDHTIAEIRRMTYALMPPSLIDFGVGETLKTFVKLISNTTQIDIDFNNSIKTKNSKINTNIAISVFRISQELINNSVKHANASKIRISITEFDNYLSIYYFDDGIGYDTEKVKLGSGILNIKERVEILDGLISFESEPENSNVEIEIPLTHE